MSTTEQLRDKFFRADVRKVIKQSKLIKDLQKRIKALEELHSATDKASEK